MKKMVAFQIAIELYEKLRKSAYDRHISVSEMIRLIIEDYYHK